MSQVEPEYEFNDIEVFNTTNAVLAELKEQFKTLPDSKNSKDDGYKFIKEGKSSLQKLRKAVDNARKKKTEFYRSETKKINDEGNRIIDEIKVIEAPLIEAKDNIDQAEERAKQERLARLQKKVDEIGEFVQLAKGQDSEQIQIYIDCVENIDTLEDFYDLKDEATSVRAKTISDLSSMLSERITYETAEKERIAAEAATEEAKEETRKLEAKTAIDEKINNLKMIPVDFIDKSSDDVQEKINALEDYVIREDLFFDRTSEAEELKEDVIGKLNKMLKTALIVEEANKQPEPEPEHKVEEPEQSTGLDKGQGDFHTEAIVETNDSGEIESITEIDKEWVADKKALTLFVDQIELIELSKMQSGKGNKVKMSVFDLLHGVCDDLKLLINEQ